MVFFSIRSLRFSFKNLSFFKLLSQTKKIRDRSLKNDKFLKENLKERIEKNTIGYSVEEVVKLWNDKESIQEKGREKEIEILLEHWQVTKETEKD